MSIDFRGSSIALSEPRDFRHEDGFSVWFNSNRWSAAGHLHAITGSLSFKQEFPVSRAGKLSGNVRIAYSACWRPRVEAARDLGGAESLSD